MRSTRRTGVTVNQIKTWEEYYFENGWSVPSTALFPVDDDINRKVSLWEGDITRLRVDAIVNAANESLLGGGGVDHAIHRAAGPGLKEECRPLRGALPGRAKITGGHKLPATYVIHAVGPRNKDAKVLRSAYESSLMFTVTHPIRTIAFPSISTGIFGFPPHQAAPIACEVVRDFLERHNNRIDRIIFAVYSSQDRQIYETAMRQYFPVEPSRRHTVKMTTSSTMESAKPRRITLADLSAGASATPSTSTSSMTSFGSETLIPSTFPTASDRRPTFLSAMPTTSGYPSRSGRRIGTEIPITSATPTTSDSSWGSFGSIRSARRMRSTTPISSAERRTMTSRSGSRRPKILCLMKRYRRTLRSARLSIKRIVISIIKN